MPKPRFAAVAVAALAAAMLIASGCTKPVSAPQSATVPLVATPAVETTTPATSETATATATSPDATVASKPSKPPSLSADSLKASLSAAAKAASKSEMDGQGSPYQIVRVNVAKDSGGSWWGHVVTLPAGGEQLINFWAKYESGTWNLTVQDVEPPPPSTFFPASVIPKLDL
jgi:hypothetical protein